MALTTSASAGDQSQIKLKHNFWPTQPTPTDSTWHIHRWICTLYRVTAVSMMSMWLSYNATCFQESYRSFIRNVTTLSNKYSHCTRRGRRGLCEWVLQCGANWTNCSRHFDYSVPKEEEINQKEELLILMDCLRN